MKKQFVLALVLFAIFFTSDVLNAQCPGSGKFTDPVTIGNAENCTPITGMLQWNQLNSQLEIFNGSNWSSLGNTANEFWSYSGNSTNIFNTDLKNVGIGMNNPDTKLYVADLNISVNRNPAQKLDFGTNVNSIFTYGILIEGTPLGSSQKGQMEGVVANTYSDHVSQTGSATGRLATSKSFGTDGGFVGASGVAFSSNLINNNPSKDANLLGGNFALSSNTDVTLSGNNFWVGGIKGTLAGNINNTPAIGAVAAVMGIDNSTGSAQSWAGYFDGKGYFGDKVLIGTKDIPSTAGGNNVDFVQLVVTGGVLTEEVIVSPMSDWADYVFEENYDLKPLEEVEQYIQQHKHLPNVPSQEEIKKSGLHLKDITLTQQEKIEELFLYVIELKKEKEQLAKENTALKNQLENIETRLSKLEQQ